MNEKNVPTRLTLALLACAVASPAVANLLANPGFESPDAGPAPMVNPTVDDWIEFNTSGVTKQQARPGSTGDQSLRLAPNAPTGTGTGIVRQDFPASANDVFTFSTYVFHPSGDPVTGPRTASMRLQWFNGSGNLINQVLLEVLDEDTPTDQWIFVELENFQLPDNPNIVDVRPALIVANNSTTVASSGAAFFDDVSFVEVTPPAIPGDFDGDGDVDVDDFGVFVNSFQLSPQGGPPFADGDFDEDGDVDVDDFGVFVNSFQMFPPAGPPPAVAVPEPGAAALAVVAGLGLVARRR